MAVVSKTSNPMPMTVSTIATTVTEHQRLKRRRALSVRRDPDGRRARLLPSLEDAKAPRWLGLVTARRVCQAPPARDKPLVLELAGAGRRRPLCRCSGRRRQERREPNPTDRYPDAAGDRRARQLGCQRATMTDTGTKSPGHAIPEWSTTLGKRRHVEGATRDPGVLLGLAAAQGVRPAGRSFRDQPSRRAR